MKCVFSLFLVAKFETLMALGPEKGQISCQNPQTWSIVIDSCLFEPGPCPARIKKEPLIEIGYTLPDPDLAR
jgi:hypothetical protein